MILTCELWVPVLFFALLTAGKGMGLVCTQRLSFNASYSFLLFNIIIVLGSVFKNVFSILFYTLDI